MKELQPINQQVLLELTEDKSEQKTAAGIIIPDSAKGSQKTAKVVALSAIENAEVAIGDVVLYKEYSGTQIDFEGKHYLLIPYTDILSKVVETEAI
ncbi:GroES family chaperonin [Sunxiuqinia elliptica]|nr:co-chaperone GroES [Sunxiuqinia elliptica]